MGARIAVVVLCALLSACAQNRTCPAMPEELLVPVAEKRRPPAALLAPIATPAPFFIAPCDPRVAVDCRATSALTAEGEVELRRWVDALRLRNEAWHVWAED